MLLSEFILSNLEKILQEWGKFAASLLRNGRQMDKVALRDHLKKMLETMAADLALPQTAYEEIEKSKKVTTIRLLQKNRSRDPWQRALGVWFHPRRGGGRI